MATLVPAGLLGLRGFLWAKGLIPGVGDRAPGAGLVVPLYLAIVAAIFALQFTNAMFIRELWPFFLGLLVLTAWSLFQFAYVLFAPSRAEVQA